MGNLLVVSDDNYLLSEIHETLFLLTNCNSYLGTAPEIITLQTKIAKLGISQGFYIPVTYTKSIFGHSPIKDHLSIIDSFFCNKKYQQINTMEIIASLITYSACTLEKKVELALEIFDLDGNHVITKDEMMIMCISFMRGIGIMVQAALYNKSVLESLASEAFDLADADPDGMITFEE